MHLVVTQESDGVRVSGQEADPGETLTCEGCEQEVTELFEDDGMNLLCEKCIVLP
jgi:hypothetical protein